MSEMTELQQAVTVGAAVFATILTRFLPYILFPAGKETPAFVRYLGRYLAWPLSCTCSIRTAGGLLSPERLIFFRRDLRNSGDSCDCGCDGYLSLEAEHADLHGFRYDSVYGSGPDVLFIACAVCKILQEKPHCL